MNLEEYCGTLTEEQKLVLSVRLIKTAMPAWERFAGKNKLTYRDSVVLLKHEVDKNLLQNVIEEIESVLQEQNPLKKLRTGKYLLKLYEDFCEPVTAVQDDDWKMTHAAEKIFYSVYNLLSAVIEGNGPAYYVAINQAIDAIETDNIIPEEEIRFILKDF